MPLNSAALDAAGQIDESCEARLACESELLRCFREVADEDNCRKAFFSALCLPSRRMKKRDKQNMRIISERIARGEMRKNIKSSALLRRAQHGRREDFSMFAIIIFLITHSVVYYSLTKGRCFAVLFRVLEGCRLAPVSRVWSMTNSSASRNCLHARITFHR